MTLQNKTDNKTQNKAQNKGQKALSPEADLVRRFMRYLKLDRNYSVNTQEAYSHDLGYFMRFLPRAPAVTVGGEARGSGAVCRLAP